MSKSKSKYPELLQYSSSEDEEEEEDDFDVEEENNGDIIRCLCHDTSDDGFTIQCEDCETWQHASCVQIKKKTVPEHYVCVLCRRKRVKRNIATTDTRSLRKNISETQDRKKKNLDIPKKQQRNSDSDESLKYTELPKRVTKEKVVDDLFKEVRRQWLENYNSRSSVINNKKITITHNKGLESIIGMESNLLLPSIPKYKTLPIRRSLRSSFSFPKKRDISIKLGVYADIHIPENRYLMEVTGKALRKLEYKNDTRNNFLILGTPLSQVFFYPYLDICIDARKTGNDSRFIRRSCCPNSEVKSIILKNNEKDQIIHMGVYTKDDVDKGEEITIGWNWKPGVLLWKMNEEFISNVQVIIMDKATKNTLKSTMDLITSEFGECACEDEEGCLFEYLKKQLERKEETLVESPSPVAASSSKKKRSTSIPGNSRATRKESLTPTAAAVATTKLLSPRVKSIFTADEAGPSRESKGKGRASTKNEKKPVQVIGESKLASQKSTIIPSSPAVSVEESVDIDITSMSPAVTPPQPVTSENEMENLPVIGTKRSRAVGTGIQLPCKKRWLREYMAHQQKLKTQQQSSPNAKSSSTNTSVPSQPIMSPEEIVYDEEGESSDGGSSQSTLPLDDIPTARHPRTQVDIKTTSQQTANDPVTVKPENDNTNNTLQDAATSVLPETTTTTNQISQENKVDDEKPTPTPKVKLSVQEYLKRRRGNLPIPDEKS